MVNIKSVNELVSQSNEERSFNNKINNFQSTPKKHSPRKSSLLINALIALTLVACLASLMVDAKYKEKEKKIHVVHVPKPVFIKKPVYVNVVKKVPVVKYKPVFVPKPIIVKKVEKVPVIKKVHIIQKVKVPVIKKVPYPVAVKKIKVVKVPVFIKEKKYKEKYGM